MKLNKMKKALSILLTLVMMVGMMPAVSFEAEAEDTVTKLYLQVSGNYKKGDIVIAEFKQRIPIKKGLYFKSRIKLVSV